MMDIELYKAETIEFKRAAAKLKLEAARLEVDYMRRKLMAADAEELYWSQKRRHEVRGEIF